MPHSSSRKRKEIERDPPAALIGQILDDPQSPGHYTIQECMIWGEDFEAWTLENGHEVDWLNSSGHDISNSITSFLWFRIMATKGIDSGGYMSMATLKGQIQQAYFVAALNVVGGGFDQVNPDGQQVMADLWESLEDWRTQVAEQLELVEAVPYTVTGGPEMAAMILHSLDQRIAAGDRCVNWCIQVKAFVQLQLCLGIDRTAICYDHTEEPPAGGLRECDITLLRQPDGRHQVRVDFDWLRRDQDGTHSLDPVFSPTVIPAARPCDFKFDLATTLIPILLARGRLCGINADGSRTSYSDMRPFIESSATTFSSDSTLPLFRAQASGNLPPKPAIAQNFRRAITDHAESFGWPKLGRLTLAWAVDPRSHSARVKQRINAANEIGSALERITQMAVHEDQLDHWPDRQILDSLVTIPSRAILQHIKQSQTGAPVVSEEDVIALAQKRHQADPVTQEASEKLSRLESDPQHKAEAKKLRRLTTERQGRIKRGAHNYLTNRAIQRLKFSGSVVSISLDDIIVAAQAVDTLRYQADVSSMLAPISLANIWEGAETALGKYKMVDRNHVGLAAEKQYTMDAHPFEPEELQSLDGFSSHIEKINTAVPFKRRVYYQVKRAAIPKVDAGPDSQYTFPDGTMLSGTQLAVHQHRCRIAAQFKADIAPWTPINTNASAADRTIASMSAEYGSNLLDAMRHEDAKDQNELLDFCVLYGFCPLCPPTRVGFGRPNPETSRTFMSRKVSGIQGQSTSDNRRTRRASFRFHWKSYHQELTDGSPLLDASVKVHSNACLDEMAAIYHHMDNFDIQSIPLCSTSVRDDMAKLLAESYDWLEKHQGS